MGQAKAFTIVTDNWYMYYVIDMTLIGFNLCHATFIPLSQRAPRQPE